MKIEDVAQQAGYFRWHLQRMFYDVINERLNHYIREKKLVLAASELCTTTLTMMDISLKYGYESQPFFTHSFV